jgi:hypothetical protein
MSVTERSVKDIALTTPSPADAPPAPATPVPVQRLDRRQAPRVSFRGQAQLNDAATGSDVVLHTRDASANGAGFVSKAPLAHRGRGTVRLKLASGQTVEVGCTIRRARVMSDGWVEGYAEFDQPVDVFSTKEI